MADVLPQDAPLSVEDCQMSLHTANLERDYASTLSHTVQLLDTENSRIQRVEQLLLQFENESLRWQLEQAQQELSKATRADSDVYVHLRETLEELSRSQESVRAANREIENLRRELASFNEVSVESKKLVAEKIRLSKDLSATQSELERLKSQAASSNNAIADKQALERQLNSLEVQMENERRAHERTLTRESQLNEELKALVSKLEESRKALAEAESRPREEDDAKRQRLEWTDERASFERKIETLNKKLRTTKDQLQEAQNSLQQPQEAPTSGEVVNTTTTRTVPLKQQAATSRFNPELTIATPGAVRAKDKKKHVAPAPVEKSAFSITPFLNRTKGGPESSSSDDSDDDLRPGRSDEGEPEEPSNGISKREKSVGAKSHESGSGDELAQKPRKQRLGQTKSKATAAKKTQRKPTDAVDFEEQINNSSIFSRVPAQAQPKTKKRKLGGQREPNLFDGDDDDELGGEIKKPQRKFPVGAGRNLPLTNPLGGGFSPLKKDKKRF